MEISNRQSRQRAVQLSPDALARLKSALTSKWQSEAGTRRLTRDLRAELLGLSVVTSERLLRGERVDRATLVLAFRNVALELLESDVIDERPAKVANRSNSNDVDHEAPETLLKRGSGNKRRSLLQLTVLTLPLVAGITFLSFLRGPSDDTRRARIVEAYQVGLRHYHQGRLREAQMEVDRILALARSFDSAYGLADSLRLGGDVAAAQGRLEEAETMFTEAYQIHSRFGAVAKQAELWEAIGNVQLRQGKLDVAEKSFESSLSGNEGSMIGKAMAYRGLGSVAFQRKDLAKATDLFQTALACLRGYEEPGMVIDLQGRLALVQHKLGHSDAALKQLFECLRYWEEVDSLRSTALAELDIGTIALDTKDYDLAERFLTRSKNGFMRVGDDANLAHAQKLLNLWQEKSRVKVAN